MDKANDLIENWYKSVNFNQHINRKQVNITDKLNKHYPNLN